MAFARPDNNKSIWRSKPDIIQGEAATVKADFDRLLNENADDLIALLGELEAETAAASIGKTGGGSVQDHIDSAANPHAVTKAQVGLANCDNTADPDKPVSAATLAALNQKVDKIAGKGLSANDYDNAEKAAVSANTAARHTHPNKALLDAYAQSEADLADAVAKRHAHANAAVLNELDADDLARWDTVTGKAASSEVLTKTNAAPYTPTADYHPATKKYADEIAAAAGAVVSVFGRAGAVTAQAGDYTAAQVGARPDTWIPTAAQVGARPNTWAPTPAEVGAAPVSHASGAATYGAGSDGAFGHVKLSDSVSSASGVSGGVAATPAAVKAAYDTAAAAYGPANKPSVSGIYTGDQAASRFINLGFTPSAVLVCRSGVISETLSGYSGFAVTERGASGPYGGFVVDIAANGFNVYYDDGLKKYTNAGSTYHYIAFK